LVVVIGLAIVTANCFLNKWIEDTFASETQMMKNILYKGCSNL